MREGDSLVVNRNRLHAGASIGQELEFRLVGRVRRIEADHVDVTGFSGGGPALAVLEGEVFVEMTVLELEEVGRG